MKTVKVDHQKLQRKQFASTNDRPFWPIMKTVKVDGQSGNDRSWTVKMDGQNLSQKHSSLQTLKVDGQSWKIELDRQKLPQKPSYLTDESWAMTDQFEQRWFSQPTFFKSFPMKTFIPILRSMTRNNTAYVHVDRIDFWLCLISSWWVWSNNDGRGLFANGFEHPVNPVDY